MGNKKDIYLGSTYSNKYGETVEIIEYNNNKDVYIKYGNGYVCHTQINNLKQGRFSSPYAKKYCGVGFIGEGDYSPTVNGVKTNAYKAWCQMLERCYGNKSTENNVGYKSTVIEEWHCFQNFAKWYEENYYEVKGERMCLDKDILVKNNTLYSPLTSCIVPNSINTLLIKSDKARGQFPIGVSFKKGEGYYARCNNEFGHTILIGIFDTPKDAFKAYKKFKENTIYLRVKKLAHVLPTNVVDALLSYEVEIDD